jgi:hypothetical protein
MLKLFLCSLLKQHQTCVITTIIKKRYPKEYSDIIKLTDYLPINCKFIERIYQIINDVNNQPKCYCGDNCNFINFQLGYHQYCSTKCLSLSSNINLKKQRTCLKKYGAIHPLQSKIIQEKSRKTCLKKYGVEYSLQVLSFREKGKQTNLKNYGVENTSQRKEIKEKKKETCLKNYGVEFPLQSKKIQIKTEQTNLKKYGVTNPYQISNVRKIATECLGGRQYTKPHKKVVYFLKENNIGCEIEKNISPYWVDIFIEPNKIIEVYGDYWHGNPKFYQENNTIGFPSGKKILVKERRQKDDQRINYLKRNNQILILWEDEIKNNFGFVKERILNFCTEKKYES